MLRRSVLRSLAASLVASPLVRRASAWSLSQNSGVNDTTASCSVRMIALNQLGFRPDHAKRAAVVFEGGRNTSGPDLPPEFRVLNAENGMLHSQGRLARASEDAASGDVIAWADISQLAEPGTYRIEVCGRQSDPFRVGSDVYGDALRLTMRSFYGQRCGCKVDLGGGYHHAACHMAGGFHPSSGKPGKMPNSGGWHDAGDYGRYVVNSGISTATLLWAWEMFPEAVRALTLDIPESGGKVPDFLAEIQWNLNWMLSMQDAADGGVWHKQTSEAFCGFIMPEEDQLTSYMIGTGREPYKSTAATADLAAVSAIAARCFRPYDAAYADRCLSAARRAWIWAKAHPGVVFKNPQGITTGEYGDRACADEILWASAELFRTTGSAEYGQAFTAALPGNVAIDTPTWGNLAPLAYWTYCMAEKADPGVRERLVKATADAATLRILQAKENGYGHTLHLKDYHWGSNGAAGNDALLLLMAHHFQPNRAAVEAAMGNLHYLLGCNCFGVSWVTQLGARPFQHPHHRPSAADNLDAPWPGLLSGGPNAGGGDAVANAMPKQPPMKMWVDDQRAYSMNEIAINWNAPLVFLLAAANSKII